MARITCEYCNTEFESDMDQCPLCGMPNQIVVSVPEEEPEQPRTDGDDKKSKKVKKSGPRVPSREDKIPRWICVLICIFLSLAVIVGSIYALLALDIIKIGKGRPKENASLDLVPSDGEPGTEPAPAPEPEPEPEPIQIDCTGLRMEGEIILSEMGRSASFNPVIEPKDCTDEISWVSSNPAVCTVDSTGLVTALGEGSAVVTAVCGEQSATATVICDFGGGVVAADGIALSSDDVTLLAPGETVSLTVEGIPDGAEVEWTSDDSEVCTVEDGVITAEGPGVAVITAETEGKTLTCTVRCRFEGGSTGNTKNRLDHDDVSLKVGENFEISVVDGVSGGWNVTDGTIITVDGNGIVTGLAKGTASVYTVVDGERLECIVRVS